MWELGFHADGKEEAHLEKFSLVFGYLKLEMLIRLPPGIAFESTNLEQGDVGRGVNDFDSSRLKVKEGL